MPEPPCIASFVRVGETTMGGSGRLLTHGEEGAEWLDPAEASLG
jgi:hypothetical protein